MIDEAVVDAIVVLHICAQQGIEQRSCLQFDFNSFICRCADILRRKDNDVMRVEAQMADLLISVFPVVQLEIQLQLLSMKRFLEPRV